MTDTVSHNSQSALNLRFYFSDWLHLIRKYWLLILVVPALLMGGVVFYHLKGTKYYGASASVFMDPSFGQRIQTEAGSSRDVASVKDDEEALFSMEETICSDAMIRRVLLKLELMNNPNYLPAKINKRIDAGKEVGEARVISAVRKRYNAELVNATRILKVNVEDTNPSRAVQIAETFISEFVLFLQEQRVKSEVDLKNNLMAQASMIKQRAIDAEKNLNVFRSKQNDFLVEQDSDIFNQQMLDSSAELSRTNSELIKVETLLRGLNQIDANQNPVRILNLSRGQDAVDYEDILSQRAEATVRLADIKQRFGPSHQDYRAAYNQYISIDQSIKSYAQEVKNTTSSRYTLLLNQKNSLIAEMEAMRQKFGAYKFAGAEFRGLQASVEREWQHYDRINQRILNLTAEAELSPNLATPLGDPIVPYSPVKKYVISATAGAMLVSAGWVALVGAVLLLRGLPFTCQRQINDLLSVPVAATLSKKDLGHSGVLSQLPLLTGSAKVLHLTSVDQVFGAESICKMVTESYRSQGQDVTVVQVTDFPGQYQYEFSDSGIDAFEVTPSQIQVRRLRIKIRDFLNKDPNRTIIVDSTSVKHPETKLALAAITNATAILVREEGVSREHAMNWFTRFTRQSGNVVALYQEKNFPPENRIKALPMKGEQKDDVETEQALQLQS